MRRNIRLCTLCHVDLESLRRWLKLVMPFSRIFRQIKILFTVSCDDSRSFHRIFRQKNVNNDLFLYKRQFRVFRECFCTDLVTLLYPASYYRKIFGEFHATFCFVNFEFSRKNC